MAVMHESIDDPQLVAAANVFVDDIIETAKVEAAQRTMVKQYYYRIPITNYFLMLLLLHR